MKWNEKVKKYTLVSKASLIFYTRFECIFYCSPLVSSVFFTVPHSFRVYFLLFPTRFECSFPGHRLVAFSIGPEFGHKLICEKSSENFFKISDEIKTNKEIVSEETQEECKERVLQIFSALFERNFSESNFLKKNLKNLVIFSAIQVSKFSTHFECSFQSSSLVSSVFFRSIPRF